MILLYNETASFYIEVKNEDVARYKSKTDIIKNRVNLHFTNITKILLCLLIAMIQNFSLISY